MKTGGFIIVFLIFFAMAGKLAHPQISLMSFNIRYDNPADGLNAWDHRKGEVLELISHYHPDFLGLQEGLHHQLQFILNNTGDYAMIGVGREDGRQKGEYAAILYDTNRYSLIRQSTYWLSETPDTVSVGWDAALERVCTCGHFRNKANARDIFVFNTHFDHIGVEARVQSARLILQLVKEFGPGNEPIVLMGDMNSHPGCKAIQILNSALEDGYQLAGSGPEGTFNGFDPDARLDERIDYIFIKNLRVKSSLHITDRRKNGLWISDHLPVMLEAFYK